MPGRYFFATISQLERRARLLRAEIPRDLPREYDVLSKNCGDRLDRLLETLRLLRDDEKYQHPNVQKERTRALQRAISDMDILEAVGIAALTRRGVDDDYLNQAMSQIRREIAYPLIVPAVTSLSQQYFGIYPELNLLTVPLVEGRFLLHLPDLYHELGHPLLAVRDDPKIEPFQERFMEAVAQFRSHIHAEADRIGRGKGPDYHRYLLEQWDRRAFHWVTEFFCDVFGASTLGTAYAWSHLHLTMKRGGDPFSMSMSSHPTDAARMDTMLQALRLTGMGDPAREVEEKWGQLMELIGAKAPDEFRWCYPSAVLGKIAELAVEGAREIGCRVATKETSGKVHDVLNAAWDQFWSDAEGYVAWEERAVAELKQELSHSQ